MPRKRGSDLVLFSSTDPQPLVEWLCDTYGLQAILQAVAQYQPTRETAAAPAKRAYKKRAAKKGATKKGGKKGGGKRGGKRTNSGGEEAGSQ